MIYSNLDLLYQGQFQNLDIEVDDSTGRILHVGKIKKQGENFHNLKVIPGLIDPHTHGGDGFDFNSAKNQKDLQRVLLFYIKNGVTSVFPTVMTDDDATIKRALNNVKELAKTNLIIQGIHLEGPFLSEEFKGAQPKEFLQPLDINKFNEYQEAAGGLIKYITISPELPNTKQFTKDLIKQGVHVSLGHSGATFDETTVAIKEGANGFTHTMNAMKPIHQHFPSILSAATFYDKCYCELILDGIHVHPEMVQWLTHIKTYKKIVGVTDSLMSAGLPNGDYFIGSTPITVKDGDCKITGTNTRAGSTLKAIDGFKNFKKFTGLGDVEASDVWSKNVAKMLGLDKDIGSIEVGTYANFIVLDENDNLVHSYIRGIKQF
ncbi:MAG: N-acetylglucosamine-6-phosphate deacetylase [Erysipelotrichaceae bacterium]|jgi:N-acetylglucosamine-6-phosphate deacetylase|nr:N-acetylglucosamine-6-phosphate deacetylase [Erysipelotrichaceae bacterium]MCB9500168.1 N-acetylglucosamine-6-phosphate deacetylase [Erysipelotrichaceae bacterium]